MQGSTEAEIQAAKRTVSQRVKEVLASFSAGKLSFDDAGQQLEELKASALAQRRAAGSLFGQEDASSGPYEPRPGETVRLLSMGGKTAQVRRRPPH